MDSLPRLLHQAALKGDVSSLHHLLNQDSHLLETFTHDSIAETPLHTVTLLGHVRFAQELLKKRPVLARIHDQRGSYPLHLASAGGHMKIIQTISSIDHSLFKLRDNEGRTPLHLAAANGRVNVLKEILAVDRKLARATTNEGETILHICAANNQLEAAMLIIERDKGLVKIKDKHGNTVLHLATARKQIQMLKLLLTKTEVDVNAVNEHNFTALDVLVQGPREAHGDIYISQMLRKAGGKRGHELRPTVKRETSSEGPWACTKMVLKGWKMWQKKDESWLNEMHDTIIIVATVIATTTFSAVINPPGGFWAKPLDVSAPAPLSNKGIDPGKAVHNNFDSGEFKLFMYFDIMALVTSLTIIRFLVSGLPLKNKPTTWILVIAMWGAVSSMTIAFVFGTKLITASKNIEQKLYFVVVIWSGLIGILLLCHAFIFSVNLLNWLKKMIYKVPKDSEKQDK